MFEKERKAQAAALADKYISKDGTPTATGGGEVVKLPADVVAAAAVRFASVDDDLKKIDLKKVVAELAKLEPLAFDQVAKSQAEFLGVQLSTLRKEVQKARQGGAKKPEAVPPSPVDINKLEELAGAIIDSDEVLDLFERAWSRVMAGEKRNARLLYLMATTRLFDKCMSGAIKGPSSAGKSELRHRVLDFIPPEDVISFTTLSEKALLYVTGDFAHKILSMGEAAGADEQNMQDYLLRELISAGKLICPTVQKIGNELMTVVIEKNGPVCFFVTTTKAALHPENETRLMSMEVDDSGEQTAVVIDKVAEGVGLNAEKTIIDYEPWRNFQRWLAAGNCKVVVPFARELGKLIPPRSVRLRRDFSQILLAIKAHALIHRQHRRVDDRGQIVADLELDYRPVAKLMGGIISEASGTAVAKEVQETINAVRVTNSNLPPDDGATAFEVAKLLKLDKSSAWRRLKVTENKGYTVNLEVRRGQPGRYRLTDQEVETVSLLPRPEEIAVCASGGSKSAQPCNSTAKAEEDHEDNGCMDQRNRDATGEADEIGCEPVARSHATANPLEKYNEAVTGCTVAPVSKGMSGATPCSACDGLGCPSCLGLTEWQKRHPR
jgi:hypothetical protein